MKGRNSSPSQIQHEQPLAGARGSVVLQNTFLDIPVALRFQSFKGLRKVDPVIVGAETYPKASAHRAAGTPGGQ